jgi:hypothetical protein
MRKDTLARIAARQKEKQLSTIAAGGNPIKEKGATLDTATQNPVPKPIQPAASITVHVPQARAWRITPVKRDVYGNEVTDGGSSSVRLIPQSEMQSPARETIGTRAEG